MFDLSRRRVRDGDRLEEDFRLCGFEVFGRAPVCLSLSLSDDNPSFEWIESVESIFAVFESIPTFRALILNSVGGFSSPEDGCSFEKLFEALDNILTFPAFALKGDGSPLCGSFDSFRVTPDRVLTFSERVLNDTFEDRVLFGESEESLERFLVTLTTLLTFSDSCLKVSLLFATFSLSDAGLRSEESLDNALVTFFNLTTFADPDLKEDLAALGLSSSSLELSMEILLVTFDKVFTFSDSCLNVLRFFSTSSSSSFL